MDFESIYVLHRRPYRNTSLIIEVLTSNYGRVGLLARSARGPKSRFKGLLSPFLPLSVTWSGRGELKSLTAAEMAGQGISLVGDRLLCGMYLNELLMRLLAPHDPHPSVFELYQQALWMLSRTEQLANTLRYFEWDLLQLIGYGFQVQSDIAESAYYAWVPELGFVESDAASEHLLISGDSLLHLARHDLKTAEQAQQAKKLMRAIINHHLGGKPLNSRLLFA